MPRSLSISFFFISVCVCSFLSGCGRNPPASPSPSAQPSKSITQEPVISPSTTEQLLRPSLTPVCSDDLVFIDDITIPDDTIVSPGSKLDKQWRVKNAGDCNWDGRYRLRLIVGDPLGAAREQALFPARVNTEVNLRIIFDAPQEAGIYISEWQAFDANGIPFGESFFIKIIVQP